MNETRYKWKTKGGEILYVDEMGDVHLLNSYRLVQRKLKDLSENITAAYGMSGFLSGDAALDQIDRDIRWLEDIESSFLKTLKVLKNEIEKRGLSA